jgi:hypothetical protein
MFLHETYDDDHPIDSLPGDDNGNEVDFQEDDDEEEEVARNTFFDDGIELEDKRERMNSKKFKTCSHYRQLTTKKLASNLHATCIPNPTRVNCCTVGGEKSKFGAHDIEDLVNFGVQPNIKKGVAIYRDKSKGESSFGMTLIQDKSETGTIMIKQMKPNGAVAREGSLQVHNTIMSINGTDVVPGNPLSITTKRIKESKDPLMVDAYGGSGTEIDVNEYSSESACPYYLSRALAKRADLIFCPYNYVLDKDIRNAMEIDVEDAISTFLFDHNTIFAIFLFLLITTT